MDKHLAPDNTDWLEALELTKRFADDTGINIADSRPCMARMFYEGMAGGCTGRKPDAFKIALELNIAGLAPDTILGHLEAYGERCSPPLAQKDYAAILRSLESDRYKERYACHKLQAHCIGDMCPVKGKSGAILDLRRQSGFTAFGRSGWVGYLSGSAVKVFMALIDLRVKKSCEPDGFFIFCFGELELSSGVSRSALTKTLEDLQKIGLIDKLKIGSKWNSEKRLQTEVRLASPIPNPTKMGLKPLRSKEQDF